MNNIAIITDKKYMIDYEKFDKQLMEFNEKISTRSRIMIVSDGTIGSIIGYISNMKYHNVIFLINEDISKEELEKNIEIYKVNYLWISQKWLERENGKAFDSYKYVYLKYGFVLMAINDKPVEMHNELAVLLMENERKKECQFVKLSYQNIENSINKLISILKIKNDDIVVLSQQMNAMLQMLITSAYLKKKGKIVLTRYKPYTTEFWKFFKLSKGTSFFATSLTYELIYKVKAIERNIETLQKMIIFGKLWYVEEEYFNEYADKFCVEITYIFGQKETADLMCYRKWNNEKKIYGSVGKAILGSKMWLRDAKGNDVTDTYAQGELMYCGKNVMMGYASKSKDLNKKEDGIIIDTGELGYMDELNNYYIIGRGRKSRCRSEYGILLEDMEKMLKTIY